MSKKALSFQAMLIMKTNDFSDVIAGAKIYGKNKEVKKIMA